MVKIFNISLISELSNHIINSGGKRIRPLLPLAIAKLCGYSGSRHIILASVIEYIHTATLLHDDVVDNSKKRRGKKTANFLWGNKSTQINSFKRDLENICFPGKLTFGANVHININF